MTHILLVPVSRFSVRYRVAIGRPFSELDRLLLRAVIEGDCPNIDELENSFKLPQRPLLEVLVTLFEEGWLAMNSQGRFLATEEGRRALLLRSMPLSMRVNEQPTMFVLMEELTGQCVAVRGGVQYESQDQLERSGLWRISYRLSPIVLGATPDEGIVRGLLRLRQGEWVHSIDRPQSRGRCSYFLRVALDVDKNHVIGLPERWVPRLADALLAEARQRPSLSDRGLELNPADLPREFVGGGFFSRFSINMTDEDVLTDAAAHRRMLTQLLDTAPAKSWMLIASERFHPSWFSKEWGEVLGRSLKRGVNVDLLWGSLERTAVTESASEQLKQAIGDLNAMAGNSEIRGSLRSNVLPIASRARFVLFAPPEPVSPEAWIGAWDWLAPARDGSGDPLGLSVRIHGPELLSALSHSAAALFSSAPGAALSSLPEIWRELAEQFDRELFQELARKEGTGAGRGNCRVQLLRDRDVEGAAVEAIAQASRSLCLCSRYGEPDTALLRRVADRARILPSDSISIVSAMSFPGEPEALRGAWVHQAANIVEGVLADDQLVIGGRPILGKSADLNRLSGDVGLAIFGGPAIETARRLWKSSDQSTT